MRLLLVSSFRDNESYNMRRSCTSLLSSEVPGPTAPLVLLDNVSSMLCLVQAIPQDGVLPKGGFLLQ